jgi:hypothetical protein
MSNQKNVAWFKVIEETPEARFDSRLIEKKIDENFITHADADQFIKTLPEEKEFEFTSAEELDQQVS